MQQAHCGASANTHTNEWKNKYSLFKVFNEIFINGFESGSLVNQASTRSGCSHSWR